MNVHGFIFVCVGAFVLSLIYCGISLGGDGELILES